MCRIFKRHRRKLVILVVAILLCICVCIPCIDLNAAVDDTFVLQTGEIDVTYKILTEPDSPTDIGTVQVGNGLEIAVDNGITSLTLSSTVQYNGNTYSVTKIGKYAFESCTQLQHIILPDSITVIDELAFSCCSMLTLTSLPSGVVSIGEYAFNNCSNIELKSLPENLQVIPNYAFNNCEKIKLTMLPSGVKSIGNNAFRRCSAITLTSLPPNLTFIGDNAFEGCTYLALQSLPNKLSSIGENAFRGCLWVVFDTIPDSVVMICNSAFSSCSNLKTLTFVNDTAPILGTNVFDNCNYVDIRVPGDSTGYNGTNWPAEIITYMYTISGTVKNSSGQVLSGATVRLLDSDSSTSDVTMTTGSDGKYSFFMGVADGGSYSVTVSKIGYSSKTLSGSIASASVTKNFSMSLSKNGWYTNSDGTMSYYVNDVLQKNKWLTGTDGEKRYINSVGKMVINEFVCDGTYTYYLQSDGSPMKNRLTYHPDGVHVIYFDSDGHEVFDDFVSVKKSISGDVVNDLCYFNTFGYMYVDVLTYDKSGDNLLYANPYGIMESNGWFQFSDGGVGYSNADGTLMVSTFTYDQWGRLVYIQGDGHIARGLISDGVYYYQMDETDGHYIGQFSVN